MTIEFTRRDILASLAALGIVAPQLARAEEAKLNLGAAKAFSFEELIKRAKQNALGPYTDNAPPRAGDILQQVDYDAFGKIQFRKDHTLQVDGGKAPIRLFHLQRYAQKPVGIYVVEGNKSREVLYSPDFFDMPDDSPAKKLPKDIGFAGFRVLNPGKDTDWLAFMGAAYFRTSGEMDQFGLSARALAVDTAMPTAEEFPRFTDFFFAPSETGAVTIYAMMDSARVTGVVKFDIHHPKGVIMTINARFFARADMARVGIAPLTSMFWFSEYNAHQAGTDWRPEIHDSDGLAIWTGSGERLWRPLNNPPRVMTSSFVDDHVKGFGLCQRDRNFENYQDDGVFYERRATVWVEPLGDWGKGQVQLVEIPTDDEIHDNIVAYWVFDKPVKQGDEISVDYRLFWLKDEPYPPTVGYTYSSRIGRGGVPGQPRPPGVVKFVVDFDGGILGTLGQKDGVEADVSASSGTISGVYALPVVGTRRWRAVFDLTVDSPAPVELRLFLKQGGKALTETWLSQYHPTPENLNAK